MEIYYNHAQVGKSHGSLSTFFFFFTKKKNIHIHIYIYIYIYGTCLYILLQKQIFCHIFMFHQLQFILYLFYFIYLITKIKN